MVTEVTTDIGHCKALEINYQLTNRSVNGSVCYGETLNETDYHRTDIPV